MVRELTAVYWDRRFDAFDPELVAPFWVDRPAMISYRTYMSYLTCRSYSRSQVLQCAGIDHGPT